MSGCAQRDVWWEGKEWCVSTSGLGLTLSEIGREKGWWWSNR